MLAPRPWILLLFWSWHAIWGFGVLFGIAPQLLPALVVDSVRGLVPWGITLSAAGLLVLPGFTMLAGWRLRHDHWKLLRLFYGVGGVAFTLLFVRLFFIREATAGVELLLATLAAGAAFYTAELFGGLRRLGPWGAVVRMVGYSALLIIGLYTGVMMGLYTVPLTILSVPEIITTIGEVLTSGELLRVLAMSPFLLMFFVFMLYSFTLLLGLPVAVAVLYTRGYWRGLRAFSAERPRALGLAITGGTVAAWLLAFAALTQQPQREALARVRARPVDLAAQADNLARAEQIREGLLNAYLAPHRYWGARGDNVQLARLYRKAFWADEDVMGPQRLFNAFAAPLLYDGDNMHRDRVEAQIRYEQFFDRPLQQGEREAVLTAISATYDRDTAEAGLLDVGRRKVLLAEQELRTEIHGDLARFTLHEVYVNQTWEQQEVFYYFSLPEHAAITALWLGDTEDEAQRFPYVVAPRGAAQQVYREQRTQRVDPALLEQVGPRQYRLRAFPIPARDRRGDGEAEPLHLWMEWTALAGAEGWAAPRLAEARNVYWEPEQTVRTIDGAPAEHEGWLPARFAGEADPRVHELELFGYRVRAEPAGAEQTPWPTGRLAVVLETSLSMQEHADAVEAIFDALRDRSPAVDVYLAPSPWSAEQPRRVSLEDVEPHYYGGHTLVGALAQFDALRGEREYAAVVVLSDAGSFAFLQDDALPDRQRGRRIGPNAGSERELYADQLGRQAAAVAGAEFGAPVWLLHLGGLPHAYRDEVGDLLKRSRGGVVADLDQLRARLGGGPVEGYRWSIESREGAGREPPPDERGHDDPFVPVAARALVMHLAGELDLESLDGLDRIHEVAAAGSVVTPWSSMIVLVNDAQREALRRASEADDRFDREAESGVEATSTPMAGLELAATPEPEEWLLLSLVLLAVLWRLRAMRQEASLVRAA